MTVAFPRFGDEAASLCAKGSEIAGASGSRGSREINDQVLGS
jgi:hypothetical protein